MNGQLHMFGQLDVNDAIAAAEDDSAAAAACGVFYHEGKPGEVSYAAARRNVASLLSNPFTRGGRTLWYVAYYPGIWIRRDRRRGRDLCAPGVMDSYLRAAMLREATRGEAPGDRPAARSRVGAAAARTIARRSAVYGRYIGQGAPAELALQVAYEAQIRIRRYAHIMPRGRYNDGFNDYVNAAAMRAALRG